MQKYKIFSYFCKKFFHMEITAVIITQDEERNIGRCLESLKGVADEIVVVDSGSTDRTEALCREAGARFVSHPWEGYSGQKNYANSLATHPWILSIDADEALSPTLRESLLALKHSSINTLSHLHIHYAFNRLNNYCGHWIHHSGWYPDRKPRLFHRDAYEWDGTVHEELRCKALTHSSVSRADSSPNLGEQPEIQPVSDNNRGSHSSPPHSGLDPESQRSRIKCGMRGEVPVRAEECVLRGDLLHYTYYDVGDHAARQIKYATLAAQKAFEQGKRAHRTDLWLKPAWTFLRNYLFRLGFLDGHAGFLVCRMAAFYTFLKYAHLYAQHHS